MESENVSGSSAELVSVDRVEQTETGEEALSLIGGLSQKQMAAFEVLTTGGTIAAAAREAGVNRKTIYVWLERGHEFGVAYEQWKKSIAETSRTRLLMIGEAATVQIARSIKQGDTRAALAVAKGMGLLSPPPVGPSLTQTVARKQEAEAQKAEESAREKAVAAASFAELVDVEGFSEEMREAEKLETRNQKSE
jgi:transposase-like protein